MQEEVEVKTKKLKKLFAKYQGAVREAQDLQEVSYVHINSNMT